MKDWKRIVMIVVLIVLFIDLLAHRKIIEYASQASGNGLYAIAEVILGVAIYHYGLREK